MTTTLTLHQLNRALLARQLLLHRAELTPYDATRALVGLQAQVVNPPYIGLWTRLRQFQRDDLVHLIDQRKIVRAAFLRSTLHLVADTDYLQFWRTIQPALIRGFRSFHGPRIKGLDVDKLVATATPFYAAQPTTPLEQRQYLTTLEPDRDPNSLEYAMRSYLPLVQLPPGGFWGKGGSIRYALADQHFGRAPADAIDPRPLILRYLAAFGPASVMDVQAWSGLTKLKEVMEQMRPELRVYRDENGVELFDRPDAPLPPADTPAPVRFLPEYDNLVLSHADRNRMLPDAHRRKVLLSAGRVRSTILVDGFVCGAWKIETGKKSAVLTIEPFEPLTPAVQAELVSEGDRLLRWVGDGAASVEVRFSAGN